MDSESELLYVADAGNRRIDVFDANTGAFKFAFGWKVDKESPKEELQACTTLTGCQKGSEGSGAGQFKTLISIAVDNDPASPSHHDVYVFDGGGNTRVEKFSPAGGFLAQFGSSGECALTSNFLLEQTHQIAVGPGGVVYVGNVSLVGLSESEGFKVQAEKLEPSGACVKTIQLAEFVESEYVGTGGAAQQHLWLAVDPGGDIYASFFSNGGAPVRKFDSSGTLLGTVGPAPGGFTAGGALAVDPAADLFLATGTTIEEFDSSGAELRVFGYGALIVGAGGLAPFHSASGEIFLAERQGEPGSGRTLYLPFPKPGPIVLPEPKPKAEPVGNTKATLNAQVNPEGKATTYHAEYITEASFQKNLEEGHPGFLGATRAPASEGEDPSAGSDFQAHKVTLAIGCEKPTKELVEEGKCLKPETKYRFRAFAENADGEGEGPVEGSPFTTREPIEVIATWSSGVGAEAARLNAEVNPFGIPATGHFQYIAEAAYQQNVEEGHEGFQGAEESATIDFGEGEEATVGASEVEGLQPNTAYRYRLVASDLFVAEALSEAHTLHTFATIAKAPLPDARGYELVSPQAKGSGEVGVPTPSGGAAEFSVEPQQAAADGARLTYGSFAAFGQGPESAPATSQYLSALGPPLWSTENIDPRFEEGFARDPLVGFSEDLSQAAVIAIEPALSEDATVGFPNLYVRDNATGLLSAITTKDHEPELGKTVKHSDYCLAYGGASAGFGHVIFAAFGAALDKGDPKAEGFNLYEWSAGEGVKLVSVLPSGKAAAPKERTFFGAAVDDTKLRLCFPGEHLMRHAISADGQRVFWTQEGASAGEARLFARLNGAETVELDEPNQEAGASGTAGKGRYWDASADGSRAFFTDVEKLTADSGASLGKPDLYRYDFEAPLHHRLTDLTPAGSEAAGVAGVIGASEDGSYVYFGAAGSLYVWHEGETRLIASGADATDWSADPAAQSARVSPDGRHLAFLSTNSSPTGYDNTVSAGKSCQLSELGEGALVGGPKCAEAYLYDYGSKELSCASCDPSGARPLGPTRLPAWSTPYQQPRYLSDNGSRLFFDTLDSLSPSDTDEKRDVYEFERAGSGGCEEGSPAFSAASEGCLYLISSGETSGPTTDESYLLDASANGEGAFFSTRQRLLFTDADERFDVYDARVGGVAPTPPPPPCEGSCPEGATKAAEVPPAATSPFEAPPQRRSLECPKGAHEVKRKGKERCVRPKRRHRSPHRRGGGR